MTAIDRVASKVSLSLSFPHSFALPLSPSLSPVKAAQSGDLKLSTQTHYKKPICSCMRVALREILLGCTLPNNVGQVNLYSSRSLALFNSSRCAQTINVFVVIKK